MAPATTSVIGPVKNPFPFEVAPEARFWNVLAPGVGCVAFTVKLVPWLRSAKVKQIELLPPAAQSRASVRLIESLADGAVWLVGQTYPGLTRVPFAAQTP